MQTAAAAKSMRRFKMNKLLVCLHLLLVSALSGSQSFAQMGSGQGGGMMGNGWGWGMGYGFRWPSIVIIAILVILGIGYMMKRK
jgi:hypothetical protein